MDNNITPYVKKQMEKATAEGLLFKTQQFTRILSTNPNEQFIRELNGVQYVPTSHIQTRFDELFFGQWS